MRPLGLRLERRRRLPPVAHGVRLQEQGHRRSGSGRRGAADPPRGGRRRPTERRAGARPGLLRPRGRVDRHQRGWPLRLQAQGIRRAAAGRWGHAAALLEGESEGRLALGARYEKLDEKQGGRAAQLGLETRTGDWLLPQRLALSLGSRHGALAAALQARIGLRGAGSTVSEPKLRLEFEDDAVSAHCFVEDGRAGSCLQWRPPVLRGLHLTGGLRCSSEEDAALREYHLALDEAVVGAELEVEENLSTGLRVRRCFGEAVGDSVVQYAVTKEFEGVGLTLVWQSPLATVARYATHSVGLHVSVK